MPGIIEEIVGKRLAELEDSALFDADYDAYLAQHRAERDFRSERVAEIRDSFWEIVDDRSIVGTDKYVDTDAYTKVFTPSVLKGLGKTTVWAIPYVNYGYEIGFASLPVRDNRGKRVASASISTRGDMGVQRFGFAIMELDEGTSPVSVRDTGRFLGRVEMPADPDVTRYEQFASAQHLGQFLKELVELGTIPEAIEA
ncbi:hypothetical protein KDA23_01495 [Candidatus Saccharibacteria bacterium]|nr:hypothetical protein [Candidatus Saccharibacteria bacterium]